MKDSNRKKAQLAICIRNDDYPASLEKRKIYKLLPDAEAEKHHQMRVIDESGEDYLYPEDCFILVDLPKETERAVIEIA
ncbi:MAG: hypothetical protein ABIH23_04050 [bacterium]